MSVKKKYTKRIGKRKWRRNIEQVVRIECKPFSVYDDYAKWMKKNKKRLWRNERRILRAWTKVAKQRLKEMHEIIKMSHTE